VTLTREEIAMTRSPLAPLVLAVALAAGTAAAGAPPAKAPTTVKAVIAKWSGQQVRIVKDGSQVEVKNLLALGDDFIKVDAAEGGETYIPLSRIKSINVQGDKLFIHVN
jgi:hypothetical protein